MYKLLHIYKNTLLAGFSMESQYRKDTIVKLINSLLGSGISFLFIEAVYQQTVAVAGWSKGEVYVLSLFVVIQNGIFRLLFLPNFRELENSIHFGRFDLLLTQPAPPLFMATTRLFNARILYELVGTFVLLVVVMFSFSLPFSIADTLAAIYFMLCGLGVTYAISLLSNSLLFRYPKVGNVNDVLGELIQEARYPFQVFPRRVYSVYVSILPVAFFGFLMGAAFFHKLSFAMFIYAPLFTVVLLTIAMIVWNRQVRHYSSASS